MYLIIIALPFLNFSLLNIFGRYLGRKGSKIITAFNISISLIFSIYLLLVNLSNGLNVIIVRSFTWFTSGLLSISFEFLFDSLTILMLILILTVSFIVHIYSMDYMYQDPNLQRFLSYLSLFTFFMLLLVTSNNFIQLFFGWEGVGLCSYLLISFWSTRLNACKSAIKAIIYNKIGDCSLLFCLGLLFYFVHSLNFQVIFSAIPFFMNNFLSKTYILNLISITLLIAAIGKSAQFFLHPWLADAMEGPTPVSALIHAATMVTAGIFLVIRCSYILEYSTVTYFASFIGSITIIFSSIVAIFQYDIKKIIAYSTCSQLGYMFTICSFSGYKFAFFHLFTHGFFKALLFLSAGLLIHSFQDEQDIRKLGGLYKLLPFSFVFILIGSLTLMGTPFLSGFFSKDFILELLYSSNNYYSFFCYNVAVLSTSLTTIYSLKLFYFSYLSEPLGFKSYYKNLPYSESSYLILILLTILAFLSIFSGYLFKDYFLGLNSSGLSFSIYEFSIKSHTFSNTEFFLNFIIKSLPLYFFGLSLVLTYIFIFSLNFNLMFLVNISAYRLFLFFNQAWFFNFVYNFISTFFYKLFVIAFYFDKFFLELIGPVFLVKLNTFISDYLYKLENITTFVQINIYFFFIALILILS